MKNVEQKNQLPTFNLMNCDQALFHIRNIYQDLSYINFDKKDVVSIKLSIENASLSKIFIEYNKLKVGRTGDPNPIYWPIQPYTHEFPIEEGLKLIKEFIGEKA